MKAKLLFAASLFFLLTSCEKYQNYGGQSIGGNQHTVGELNNTFTMSTVPGISNPSAKITELTDGISTIEYSCRIDDPNLLEMAKYIPGTTFVGNLATGGGKAKITDQGIMNVYDEGNVVLIKWDASVGDEYSMKRGANTITRKVVSKSTTDDYFWAWMMIKTSGVEETGRGIPGVSKIEYQTNHKFGLVAIKAYFEDGTSKIVSIYSKN
jgi:hypothetical protein